MLTVQTTGLLCQCHYEKQELVQLRPTWLSKCTSSVQTDLPTASYPHACPRKIFVYEAKNKGFSPFSSILKNTFLILLLRQTLTLSQKKKNAFFFYMFKELLLDAQRIIAVEWREANHSSVGWTMACWYSAFHEHMGYVPCYIFVKPAMRSKTCLSEVLLVV